MTDSRSTWRLLWVAAATLLMACSGGPLRAQETNGEPERSVPSYLKGEEAKAAQLYRDVLPSVVTIYASRPSLEGDEAEKI